MSFPDSGGAILSLDADDHAGGSASASSELILISKDGARLPVARSASLISELIKTTLEGDPEAAEFPLYHIETPIVVKMISYMSYHEQIPARRIEVPINSDSMKDLVDTWDYQFVSQDQEPRSKR